jgi:hypothetical protein
MIVKKTDEEIKMQKPKIQPVILSQLEDVLEERQKSDRRTPEQQAEDIANNRRRDDRRTPKK